MLRHSAVLGVGEYLPEKVMGNDAFSELNPAIDDEWIRSRTGIRQRHLCTEDQASSDLALQASMKALQGAGMTADALDMLIVATSTPDHQVTPSTAAILQSRLGMRSVGAFDLSAACTGFIYALAMADQCIRSGFANYVLVVGVDCLSKYLDWQDTDTSIVFGDGAGAAVLGPATEPSAILHSSLRSDGSHADVLQVRAGGSRSPMTAEALAAKQDKIFMDGKAVFRLAVNSIVPEIREVLHAEGINPDAIRYLVPHQANQSIIRLIQTKLGLSNEQVCLRIADQGNTSAASIPIVLSQLVAENKLQKGDLLLLAAFGAGFTWGVTLLRW